MSLAALHEVSPDELADLLERWGDPLFADDPVHRGDVPHAHRLELLRDLSHRADASAVVDRGATGLRGLAIVRSPGWDREWLGAPVGRVEALVSRDDETLQALAEWVEEWCRREAITFCSARLPLADPAAVGALEAAGYRFVEVIVHPWYELAEWAERESPDRCRPLRKDDEDAVARIARSAFRADRFHLDPRIDTAVADAIYERWARDWFADGDAGEGMVLEEDGTVCGFVLFRTAGGRPHSLPPYVDLQLTAVDPAVTRRGTAQALYRDTFARLVGVVDYAVGSYSLRNAPMRGLHRRLGARYASGGEVTLHRWRT